MTTSERLTDVFKSSKKIPIGNEHKIIIFSDCHRGDNSWSDDFADNQNLFHYALYHYYQNGFTYIELGDGDELWENKRFQDILQAHSAIFDLIGKFYQENRFHRVLGNHDMEFKDKLTVQKNLFHYHDEIKNIDKKLFDGIEIPEGLKLEHSGTGKTVFLVHGHQGDLYSDDLWKPSRVLVRYLWKHLQLFGVHDPTSTAINNEKRDAVDTQINAWAKEHNQIVIAGHTHRPGFLSSPDLLYFNTGSCVHPRGITGIEIVNGELTLIKWQVDAVTPNEEQSLSKGQVDAKPITGVLFVNKKILKGPVKIFGYSPILATKPRVPTA